MRIALLCGALALIRCAEAFATPEVVATIKPLHALAAAVMNGSGEPALLFEAAASPHDYALKPSDLRRLASADIVLRIGESLEPQLSGVLQRTGNRDALLDADRIDGMRLLPLRKAGTITDPYGHSSLNTDPHLWLDVNNAALIAAALAARLERIDPANAKTYRGNFERLSTALHDLDGGIAMRLRPLASQSYATFHDSFQYLEARYGLTLTVLIGGDAETPISLKRLKGVRRDLKASGTRCLVVEPQHAPKLASNLAEASGLELTRIDAVGTSLPSGSEAYVGLMRSVAASFVQCLAFNE
jgi:zinc transport system substrate-binding protein